MLIQSSKGQNKIKFLGTKYCSTYKKVTKNPKISKNSLLMYLESQSIYSTQLVHLRYNIHVNTTYTTYSSTEPLSDLRQLWRQQDDNDQGTNYLTRIPLSQFFLATSSAPAAAVSARNEAGKFKRMPLLFNTFGKTSLTTLSDPK